MSANHSQDERVFSSSIGYAQADRDALLAAYLDKEVKDLPSPACLLNRSKIARNCDAMLRNAASLGASFRAHIKTHKTLEGVRAQLSDAGHGKIVVSTLMEAYSVLPLVEEGLVTDLHYGLPVVPSRIRELYALGDRVPNLRLMLDSESQLEALASHARAVTLSRKWSLFIKVDCGTHRAGLPRDSDAFKSLIARALSIEMSDIVEIYGFYSHAGHSYHDTSLASAKSTLMSEIDAANQAAKYAQSLPGANTRPFVISVGATPTAHASQALTLQDLPEIDGELELHAGCYPFCDLQQFATSLVKYEDIAIRVLAEVVSKYADRDEMLINAGCVALSRETGPIPGFGQVETPGRGWSVGRLSQEHGILTRDDSSAETIDVGQKILIVPQHACITGSAYQWYYVVDEDGLDAKVVDIWIRSNGW